jgi:hypothetical protein
MHVVQDPARAGGAQEHAKAFLCALMVAAAFNYISQSGPLREQKDDYCALALVSWNLT